MMQHYSLNLNIIWTIKIQSSCFYCLIEKDFCNRYRLIFNNYFEIFCPILLSITIKLDIPNQQNKNKYAIFKRILDKFNKWFICLLIRDKSVQIYCSELSQLNQLLTTFLKQFKFINNLVFDEIIKHINKNGLSKIKSHNNSVFKSIYLTIEEKYSS